MISDLSSLLTIANVDPARPLDPDLLPVKKGAHTKGRPRCTLALATMAGHNKNGIAHVSTRNDPQQQQALRFMIDISKVDRRPPFRAPPGTRSGKADKRVHWQSLTRSWAAIAASSSEDARATLRNVSVSSAM